LSWVVVWCSGCRHAYIGGSRGVCVVAGPNGVAGGWPPPSRPPLHACRYPAVGVDTAILWCRHPIWGCGGLALKRARGIERCEDCFSIYKISTAPAKGVILNAMALSETSTPPATVYRGVETPDKPYVLATTQTPRHLYVGVSTPCTKGQPTTNLTIRTNPRHPEIGVSGPP
jgi:hypothetical protein